MNLSIPQIEAAAPTAHRELDAELARLAAAKQRWAELALADKIALLEGLVQSTTSVAERWVAAACTAKGIAADSPLAGEEWTSGPWALAYGAAHYAQSLREIRDHGVPQIPGRVRTRADGQVIAEVFPQSTFDSLLLSGVHAEVWMQAGITRENLAQHMAAFYKEQSPHGKVSLVLGAGNIASIGPLDVLHKLYAEGQVCLLKMNPVNEYLGPCLEEAFAAYVAAGYVAFAYGGVDVGEYLTAHPAVEEMHITGSAATHDTIVFGPGEEGRARRARKEPRNPRRLTSELGNVSPVIVVPGPWTQADLAYQAEHIATMKMHNGGFNCIAGQVLVLPADWEHTNTLIAEIERVLREVANRKAYYPGAAARQQAAMKLAGAIELDPPAPGTTPRTFVPDVPASERESAAFQTEAFGSVFSSTRLRGDAKAFLSSAVDFCNDTLWGTLGCNVLIHPSTERALGAAFEDEIARLRYGCVAINAWSGVGFLIAQASWGAYPGHTIDDIRSGTGTVHNTLLFDAPQKSVIRQSFYPAPRGILHGKLALLPKPPWFITNRMAARVGQLLVEFERAPSVWKLPAIFAAALRG
jgi:aldehyde dehydrogenase (NAD(P)+)